MKNSFNQSLSQSRHPFLANLLHQKENPQPQVDYIDRTAAAQAPPEEKKIFFDEAAQPVQNVGIGIVKGLIPYDESADAAALYNPIVGT
jgi:hypothetical protein